MLNRTSLFLLFVTVHSSAQTPPGAVTARHEVAVQHRLALQPARAVKAYPGVVASSAAAAGALPSDHFTGLDHAELRRQLRQQYDERAKAKATAIGKGNP